MALKNKNIKQNAVSIAWLGETLFRCSAGWLLLTQFTYMVTMILGIYALVTAAIIVTKHFIDAHK